MVTRLSIRCLKVHKCGLSGRSCQSDSIVGKATNPEELCDAPKYHWLMKQANINFWGISDWACTAGTPETLVCTRATILAKMCGTKCLFPKLLQYSLAPPFPPMQCWTTLRQAFPHKQHCMGGGGQGRIWPKERLFPCENLIDGQGSAFCKLVPHNFGQDCRLATCWDHISGWTLQIPGLPSLFADSVTGAVVSF